MVSRQEGVQLLYSIWSAAGRLVGRIHVTLLRAQNNAVPAPGGGVAAVTPSCFALCVVLCVCVSGGGGGGLGRLGAVEEVEKKTRFVVR